MAQKQGNIWYFGDSAGLNFNHIPPTPLLNGQTHFTGTEGWNEGCSSISDSSGSLLFYTNGVQIWNKNQQIMPHGDSLMGNISSTQSSVIVPKPGSSEYFYVFTTDAEENNFANGLRYSVVDICLDNGLGDVVTGNAVSEKNIKLVDSVTEKLLVVRHINGVDYWIIIHKFNSDAFYTLKLTSTGISDTVISHTGTQDPIGWGQMAISENGLKIAYTTPSLTNGFILLLDFNPSNGIVSNEQTLSSGSRGYAVAFSPDNYKLYCSEGGIGNVYQYNLNAGSTSAIIASKTFLVQNGSDSWRQMQLGPDGKIYISRSGKTYLSEIEFPDSLYPTCNYIDSAIYLGGKYGSFGLPNFIDSYNYSNTTYSCNMAGMEQVTSNNDQEIVYPNPASNVVQVNFSHEQIIEIKLYNLLGKEIISTKEKKIDVSNLQNGIYFINVKKGEAVFTKKIIVQH